MKPRAWALALLLPWGCKEEPEATGVEPCLQCAQAESCPEFQPQINPLEACETPDAVCFYCSTVMRSFVCREGGETEGDDDPRWRQQGVVEMCPEPPPETGTSGDTGE